MTDYKALYQKFLEQTCSDEEAETLLGYFLTQKGDLQMQELIEESLDRPTFPALTAADEQSVLNNEVRIMQAIRPQKRMASQLKWYMAAAVALITMGIWFYTNRDFSPAVIHNAAQEIPPGKIGATLTLANGKKIRLSDAVNGKLAEEAGISVSKTADGQLLYTMTSAADEQYEKGNIHTLSTAKGETYQVLLPDGSRVWLNAASSISYAPFFSKNGHRSLTLSGEAYFEVAKNKTMPFKVVSGGVEVKVLGTHFNIMAYEDENLVKTTLLEGSVDVNHKILEPGQQAQTDKKSLVSVVSRVDPNDAVAWKSSLFVFRNENIQSIMKKISRWYDVDVEFRGNTIMNKNFGGTFSRNENLSSMLHTMALTGELRFKTEGRRIIVMK